MEPGEIDGDELKASASEPSREVFSAIPAVARAGWFAAGALVATAVALAVTLRPWTHSHQNDTSIPYEVFPFADNAGVCQEWVALAGLETSHDDAMAIVRRLIPVLPLDVRANNLRIVRAFAAGDTWTIAVDAQAGTGDPTRAGQIAELMNALPGTGLHFTPVFYSSRHLYDTAGVLCMPRQSATQR